MAYKLRLIVPNMIIGITEYVVKSVFYLKIKKIIVRIIYIYNFVWERRTRGPTYTQHRQIS